MKTGNNVPAAHARDGVRPRDDSRRQLRDIEELVAKLRVVTKQLQFPAGSGSADPRGAAAPAHGPLGAGPRDEALCGEARHGEARPGEARPGERPEGEIG